jgi:hypothetical protein
MTLSITHTTPADGTFSTTGAAAWDATHSLGGVADISQGGTNATTAADARTSLGLGTIATQAANSVAITGGAVDGTTVGATTVAAGSFTTLNSSGNTRLGGLSGNQSLQVNNVASAVNYVQNVGAIAGAAPTISAQGSDTHIGLDLTAKGVNGAINLKVNGSLTFIAGQSGSGAGNHVVVYPTSNTFNWVLRGTDTNVGFILTTKGTGNFFFNTGGGTQAFISDATSAVNYLSFVGAATGVGPSIGVAGSDTNINLKLTPKGTGTLQFGTYTAGIVAQAGYITITDAGGTSRRLLVG